MTEDASMPKKKSAVSVGRAKGGHARAESMTPVERRRIAQQAALARWEGEVPIAEHEGEFNIGEVAISCSVLKNGKRIIAQATFLRTLGRSRSPKAGTGVYSTADGVPFFLQAEVLRPFISEDLLAATTPVFYRTLSGGRGVGYDAQLLPQVAEVYLKYRDDAIKNNKPVPAQYSHIVSASDMLMRGLANVGIIALVDEATGYQSVRAKNALAAILEAFIAKELRPWVRTFPQDFYANLFRLRGLEFPRDTVRKPQYFGRLTNDIIYRRLAPGVLEELQNTTPKNASGRRTHHFHRRLTEDVGHPKLREHLASVVTLMRLSKDYADFQSLLDRIHPRFGENLELQMDEGIGL
jgi:hypothetical protein